MSDPKTPKTPPPCCAANCEPLTDAQRAESAEFLLNAMRDRYTAMAKELADAKEDIRNADDDTIRAEDEIEAHREFHANDLTREHRDLIRSQSLAMLSAETRIAASSAALATFCAVGEPYIAQVANNAVDYIVKALRGAGKSIGRAMDDPDIRAGFVSSLVSNFVATSVINLDDLIGSVPTPAPQGAPPSAPKSDAPTATPSPKSAPAAKKRAPKRKA